ncbi:MAG TPA: DUF4157 domain-containing protein [Pyrinomonadaceae bacterium]|nr:DUF4157 domain-containing protein [Pyrinomonadaceae bacterium]
MGNYFKTQKARVLRKADAAKAEPVTETPELERNETWQSLAWAPVALHAKLAISRPDDPDEREADRIADQVMRMATPQSEVTHGSTAAPSSLRVQLKCAPCVEDDEEQMVQRKSGASGKEELARKELRPRVPWATTSPAIVRAALSSRAEPLDLTTRSFMEERFGRDFGGVRVHTGTQAEASASQVNARAFTVGRDIVFAAGEYSPASDRGRRLLAHELTHVAQQAAAGSGQSHGPAGATAAHPPSAAPAVAQLSAPRIQREGPDDEAPTEGSLLSPESLEELRQNAIELSLDDEQWLADNFPDGFTLRRQTVDILTIGGSRANGYKLRGVQVAAPTPLESGVQAWFFHVDKGRAILVNSTRTGEGVMLDLGTGGTGGAARLIEALERVIGGGLGRAPERAIVSHTDADHMRAGRDFLGTATFSNTAIQIAAEQLNSAVGRRDWRNMGITLAPTQQLIQIQVTGGATGGGAVHENRLVYDGFVMTEFRSVAAHRALTAPGRTTFDKNATSPVTIVTDLVTGERMLYTADGTGRLFNEVINAVGEQAFVRLLGGAGPGGALRTVEYPHHGGRVSGGPDVSGVLRMLRLSFEASNGRVDFITQTSNQFAGAPGASIRFLDLVGVDVERITGGTAAAGTSEVTRLRGTTTERVTLDVSGIRSAVTMAQTYETDIMVAYQRLHELRVVQERAGTLHEGLTGAGVPRPLLESVSQIRTDLQSSETSLRTAAGRVWAELGVAAAAAGGMRSTADMTAVNAELRLLSAEVTRVDPTQARNGLQAHELNLNAYGMCFVTLARMLSALHGERYEELNQLQSRYRSLVIEARAMLGPAEVAEHVRSSWAATRAEWTPEKLQRTGAALGSMSAARRGMMTEYRADLLQSLGRQMQLQRLMEESMGGRTVYGPGGTAVMPASTRIGAGFMALIEIARIGLELAVQLEEANAAAEATASRERVEGAMTVLWWSEQGATPTLALVQRGFLGGYNVVSNAMSQSDLWDVARGNSPADTPEHEKIVVTNVPDEDLQFIIARYYLSTFTLADWHRANAQNPSGETFRHFEDGWGVRLWDEEEKRYMYIIKEAIQTPLESLHRNLEAGTLESMERMESESESGAATLSDTAWVFGQDRVAWVYNRAGGVEEIDFDAVHPRFIRTGGTNWMFGEELVVVRAIDMPTYRRLSEYYWKRVTGTWIGAGGGGYSYDVYRNREGLAMVRSENLTAAPATSSSEGSTGG